ncbi:MAG TPA: class I SAM-dependent methyltransferase [Candidatus Binatia bacterium]|nr:class I SAM-dependent methyltransferase [Candidatus Binatia bacterium]
MDKDLESWNQAASGWDSKIAKENSYRTHLITNALEKLVTNIQGLKVLDAGCGNGYFSNWLKSRGADVVGVDGSEQMVKLAKERFPQIQFSVHDLLNITDIPERSYDLILANMLVMHLSDTSTFFQEAKRLLKPDGQFIFSVLHPCFNYPTSKLYKTLLDKLTFAKASALAYDYYSQGKGRFESHLGSPLTHYHRTLEDYTNQLEKAGFVITKIVEPHQLPEQFLKANPKFEYAQRLPRFIFFSCRPI